jgi:hypothetical protein
MCVEIKSQRSGREDLDILFSGGVTLGQKTGRHVSEINQQVLAPRHAPERGES